MKSLKILFMTVFVPLAGLLAAGCYFHGPAHHVVVGGPGPVVFYHYWYYPDVRVYFDYEREIYFYMSSGTWVSTRVLPPTIVLVKDRYVKLKLDTDKPFRYQDQHQRQHPPGRAIKTIRPAPQQAPQAKNGKVQGPEKGSPQPKGKGKGAAQPKVKSKGRGGGR